MHDFLVAMLELNYCMNKDDLCKKYMQMENINILCLLLNFVNYVSDLIYIDVLNMQNYFFCFSVRQRNGYYSTTKPPSASTTSTTPLPSPAILHNTTTSRPSS